jgi:aldehyde dehydrogenase (NAD+)
MKNILKQLNIKPENKGTSTGNIWLKSKGDTIASYSPVDGKLIASVSSTTNKEYSEVMTSASKAFAVWKNIPAPKRGEIVRQIGDELQKIQSTAGPIGIV